MSKEMVYRFFEMAAPFFVGIVVLLGLLVVLALWTSPSGSLCLDVIAMDIRDRFSKKWFTINRVTKKLFPNSDPCNVQAAIEHLVAKGELKRFVNPRNGHELYRFV